MKFDGMGFAKEIEEWVAAQVARLPRPPRVVSVLVGSDPASELYTRLKKEAAERVGVDFRIAKIGFEDSRIAVKSLKEKIGEIGERQDVDGVMVQLPLPDMLRGRTPKVIEAIPLAKDVDGLRWEESGIMPATVRAVLSILERIEEGRKQETGNSLWEQKFVVVGDRGSVGRPLVHYLRERGVEVLGVNTKTREPTRRLLEGGVVISCVGRAGLVAGEMVREGVVVVDVGVSANQRISESANQQRYVGDMTREVYAKAAVSVEVPGGVGPVTVASLMRNVVECAGYKISI